MSANVIIGSSDSLAKYKEILKEENKRSKAQDEARPLFLVSGELPKDCWSAAYSILFNSNPTGSDLEIIHKSSNILAQMIHTGADQVSE